LTSEQINAHPALDWKQTSNASSTGFVVSEASTDQQPIDVDSDDDEYFDGDSYQNKNTIGKMGRETKGGRGKGRRGRGGMSSSTTTTSYQQQG
jgi:hypothetical protein